MTTPGNRRAETTAPADRPEPGPARVEANGYRGDRGRVLEDLEVDLDRLIFRVMGLGGLTEVEAGLRRARRAIILEPR